MRFALEQGYIPLREAPDMELGLHEPLHMIRTLIAAGCLELQGKSRVERG